MEKWIEPFSDSRQEMVFIGQNLDKDSVISQLVTCLLTEEESLKGENYWQSLPDPFPVWISGHTHQFNPAEEEQNVKLITQNSRVTEDWAIDRNPRILTKIYEDSIGIAIWQRHLQGNVKRYSAELMLNPKTLEDKVLMRRSCRRLRIY